MLKKSLLTFVLVALFGWVSAQTIQFEWEGVVYEDGHTIICPYDADFGEYLQHMSIRNLTDADLDIVVEQYVIEPAPGAIVQLCWGMCMVGDTLVSRPVTVPAQTLSTEDLSFHVMFTEGETGVVVVKYYAYDENTPEDRVSITLLAGQTAETTENKVAFGHAYPNPASNKVSFNIQHAGMVEATVYNLLGQEVMTQTVNSQSQSQVSFSVEDLQAGIYFCNFIANGEVLKTEKFIVKH